MKKETTSSRWKKIRGYFNTIHLWLGVGSALILFVVCLTGTVYTFSSEIQKLTDSELYGVGVPPGGKRLPVQKIVDQLPDSLRKGELQTIVIPEREQGSFQFIIRMPDPAEGGKAKGTTYFINPYTAEVLGTNKTTTSEFFQFVFKLHRWLLLETSVGRPIVGVATLIFVVIILSGLVIWFPKKVKNWRQGLTIKTSANWKRINLDLHTSLGLYSSLFLLVMALTGLTWSFEWYKAGLNNALGARKSDAPELKSVPAGQRASIEALLESTSSALPYAGDHRVALASDSTGVVTVMKTKNSFFATSVADKVILDQYSAKVLVTDVFSDKPLNLKIASSFKAIHTGSFYGTFSKIFYFFACLAGTSLPLTGVFIWINKLRKKQAKKKGSRRVREQEEIGAEA